MSNPMSKEPVTLMTKVPSGNVPPKRCMIAVPNTYRSNAPDPPPTNTTMYLPKSSQPPVYSDSLTASVIETGVPFDPTAIPMPSKCLGIKNAFAMAVGITALPITVATRREY